MKFFGAFIFAIFALSSCSGDDEEKDSVPQSATAHFRYSNYVLRSFSDQNTNLTIRIPECFEKDEYGSYGLNNNWLLKCYDNYSFISIDYFTAAEIENYYYYYEEEESQEMGDPLHYLLDYIITKRASNLFDPEISQQTIVKNERNAQFIFQSITGKESDYQDNLFFMFGAVELNGQYFIVQTICSYDNIKFLLADFKKMILSIKRV
jgi:hypothetical protein